jgi:predicted 3-demethylubiquinone-9 3-methyltransferase (glyoxalase superfamily)
MFTGAADAAMAWYTSLFPDARIDAVTRAADGTVQHAVFTLQGQRFRCFDSPPVHDFTFTPSFSLFITCDSAAEVDRLCAALAEDGQVLMPLDAYPFSPRYAWVQDRFGVSWQISLDNPSSIG